MSAADNIDLTRRETSLLGLSLVLDPIRVQDLLRHQQAIGPDDRIELVYIRYKPGRRALSLMQVVESSGGQRPLVVNACDAAGWDKLVSIRRDEDHPSSLMLPDLKCSIEWFPSDRRLRQAAKLFDPAKTAKILERVVGVRPLEPWALSMLAYKPNRRLVVKAASQTNAMVLKCYTAKDYPHAYSQICHVANARIDGCSPCVLGGSEHYSMIASGWIDGDVLSSDLGASSAWPHHFPKAGNLLAKWHAEAHRSLPMIANQHPAFNRSSLIQLAEDIVWLMPELEEPLSQLLSKIDERFDAFARGTDLIHGDFYAKQIIVQGDNLHLIDFDEVARGHRYQDLGTFVGQLYWSAVRNAADVTPVMPAINAFVGGYENQMGAIDWPMFQTSVVAGILRCLPHAFRRGLPEWRDKMRQMFEFANEWCPKASAPNTHSTRSEVDPLRFSTRSDESEVAPYLDTDWINQHWRKATTLAAQVASARVVRAQLWRHKPGKRLLVEYKLEHADGRIDHVIGKARLKKSIDRQVIQLYDDLQVLSSAGVRVPHMLGTLPTLNLWLQEKVNGNAVQPGSSMDVHWSVGQALAELHGSQVTIARSHSIDDELTVLRQQFKQWLFPSTKYAEQSGLLLNACCKLASSLVPVEQTIIHRDLYFDQVLTLEDGIALLDFDLATMGPPELDIGNYLAHLDEFAIRNNNQCECERAGEAFLAGYVDRRPCLQLSNIEVWRQLSLARLVAISQRIPTRAHTTITLLEACRSRMIGVEVI